MKVARTVLRGAALGNKCRLLDRGFSAALILSSFLAVITASIAAFRLIVTRNMLEQTKKQYILIKSSFFYSAFSSKTTCFRRASFVKMIRFLSVSIPQRSLPSELSKTDTKDHRLKDMGVVSVFGGMGIG
ncbi:hypothetical protein [Vibrio celticus]|uniref:Uncharacterized protein n=1 Tax=Vibrio celticus TaxID=446372 RepID=A0A1C3JJ38_9VIBR|nr:hypothetical protein [Vibrio celticus]SBT15147.1 hypothetical protein VCE7224_03934 [Vibrio celticus]